MSTESQRSICDWADGTFGHISELRPAADRAAQEMREFMVEVDKGCRPKELIREGADILITLYRLAGYLGMDLNSEVDKKMALNRLRKWIPDGKGNGQHDRTGRC